MAESTIHQQSVDYWGPERLAGADGKATAMRDKLIISILRALGDIRLDGIGPEAFRQLLQYFSMDDLKLDGYSIDYRSDTLDRLAEKYFCIMHIEHWHVERGSRNIPVIGTKGLSLWIMMHLFSDPIGTGKYLNTLLENLHNPLLDPGTGTPFRFNSIPVEVLPGV